MKRGANLRDSTLTWEILRGHPDPLAAIVGWHWSPMMIRRLLVRAEVLQEGLSSPGPCSPTPTNQSECRGDWDLLLLEIKEALKGLNRWLNKVPFYSKRKGVLKLDSEILSRALWVVSRGQTYRSPQDVAKSPPKLCYDLGNPRSDKMLLGKPWICWKTGLQQWRMVTLSSEGGRPVTKSRDVSGRGRCGTGRGCNNPAGDSNSWHRPQRLAHTLWRLSHQNLWQTMNVVLRDWDPFQLTIYEAILAEQSNCESTDQMWNEQIRSNSWGTSVGELRNGKQLLSPTLNGGR